MAAMVTEVEYHHLSTTALSLGERGVNVGCCSKSVFSRSIIIIETLYADNQLRLVSICFLDHAHKSSGVFILARKL